MLQVSQREHWWPLRVLKAFILLRRDHCLLFFQLKCIICRTAYFDENINALKKSPRMKTLRVYPGRYFPMEHAREKKKRKKKKQG